MDGEMSIRKGFTITGVNMLDSETCGGFKGRVVYPEEALLLDSVASVLQAAGPGCVEPDSTGIVLGVDGVLDHWKEAYFKGIIDDGPLGASPMLFPYTSHNVLAARISIEYGLKGQNLTITSGPLSFLKALSAAYGLLFMGVVRTAIVGGVAGGRVVTMLMGSHYGEVSLRDARESRVDAVNSSRPVVEGIEETFDDFTGLVNRSLDGKEETLHTVECYDRSGGVVSFQAGRSCRDAASEVGNA
ncbi:MAG: beta-ketoacyl synthase N-terminal-like domain-containing protein [Thermodesulfobacteriota bacterium]